MNVLVMGAGAIGSVFGGLLAQAGHRMHLVGRPVHMAAIRDQGLDIIGLWGEHHVVGLEAHLSVGEIKPQSCDLVLVTTKAYDTAAATEQAIHFIGRDTLVVSLQNGLGNVEAIAGLVGEGKTLGGRVIFGARLVEAGRVEVTVQGGSVLVGSPWGAVPLHRIEAVAQAFSEAGIRAEATDHIVTALWGKLLYNCCLNPLCALLRVNYGRLLDSEATRAVMEDVIQEIFAVAARRGVSLEWQRPQDYRDLLFYNLVPATAAHYGSMYDDLERGKRTEIEAMNGAVARLGLACGVSTPANRYLSLLVKAREKLASA